ncbi:MAG: hypothetical protein R2856_25185 [Caldilineaceae bacterium]
MGSQNYELPADLDLSAFRSVVICRKQFSVVFSTAELRLDRLRLERALRASPEEEPLRKTRRPRCRA